VEVEVRQKDETNQSVGRSKAVPPVLQESGPRLGLVDLGWEKRKPNGARRWGLALGFLFPFGVSANFPLAAAAHAIGYSIPQSCPTDQFFGLQV